MFGLYRRVVGPVETQSQAMAAKWPQEAASGQHYGLAFGQTNTWSLKYNLVWDRVLGLDLFDPHIAAKVVALYLKKQLAYGIALDNRGAQGSLAINATNLPGTQSRAAADAAAARAPAPGRSPNAHVETIRPPIDTSTGEAVTVAFTTSASVRRRFASRASTAGSPDPTARPNTDAPSDEQADSTNNPPPASSNCRRDNVTTIEPSPTSGLTVRPMHLRCWRRVEIRWRARAGGLEIGRTYGSKRLGHVFVSAAACSSCRPMSRNGRDSSDDVRHGDRACTDDLDRTAGTVCPSPSRAA